MSLRELFQLWHLDILGDASRYRWFKLWRRVRNSNERNVLFWYRASQYLHACDSRFARSLAKRISKRNARQYGVDIRPGASFGPGLKIGHAIGIVVNAGVVAGSNLTLRQNTTIGSIDDQTTCIRIGDNVDIGAHCCILGNQRRIGSNVRIGAMSFVNEDIPDNCTFVTPKPGRIIPADVRRGTTAA